METARRRTEAVRGRDRVRALRLHALIETLYATGTKVQKPPEPSAIEASGS